MGHLSATLSDIPGLMDPKGPVLKPVLESPGLLRLGLEDHGY